MNIGIGRFFQDSPDRGVYSLGAMDCPGRIVRITQVYQASPFGDSDHLRQIQLRLGVQGDQRNRKAGSSCSGFAGRKRGARRDQRFVLADESVH